MKLKKIYELQKSKGFGSLKIIHRLPKKSRRRCDTLESQLKAIRGTMDMDLTEMQEEFVILLLTDEKELIAGMSLYRGTADQVAVATSEIIRAAAVAGAYYIVCAHNHPNGHPQPSDADVDSSSRLSQAFRFCGLELLDDIIITRKKHFSFAENGLMRS